MIRLMFCRSLLLLAACAQWANALDLTRASVVSPPNFSAQEQQAVRVLVEEVAKRTQLTLPVIHAAPQSPAISISIGNARSGPPEGYRIAVTVWPGALPPGVDTAIDLEAVRAQFA